MIKLLLFLLTINNYYNTANINFKKNYYQVPNDELIWGKGQGTEPQSIYKGELKGKGYIEPFIDEIIKTLRKEKIIVYTEYLTPAKTWYYRHKPKYKICASQGLEFKSYKNNKSYYKDDKFTKLSIPYNFYSPASKFGILTEKLPHIEKYKYSNSNIYSVIGILDDPDLYTATIINQGSTINSFIYTNEVQGNIIIKKKYKKKVYEFVASDGIQLTMMLRGKRMHWTDLNVYRNYFINKLKIPSTKISFLEYAKKNPAEFTDDDIRLSVYKCSAPQNEKNEIDKIINIINARVKLLRTNIAFWQKMEDDFYRLTGEKFGDLPMKILLKEKIDKGEFD